MAMLSLVLLAAGLAGLAFSLALFSPAAQRHMQIVSGVSAATGLALMCWLAL